MSPQVTLEIAALQDKTVSQLVQRYEEVFKEECRSRNKQYLIRRIAWRLQANEEGGLSRAALRKAQELAVDADTRVTAPRKHSSDGVKLVAPEPNAFVDWDPRLFAANVWIISEMPPNACTTPTRSSKYHVDDSRIRSPLSLQNNSRDFRVM